MAVIAFTCGGTGGHVYPAIALAQTLSDHSLVFLMSSDRKDKEIIRAYGYDGVEVPSSNKNIWIILKGMIRSYLYLKRLQAVCLVATGGYHTVPVIIAAWLLRVPVVLLEQNVLPGRVNRYLSYFSTYTCVAFQESLLYLPKAIVTGNPVRESYLLEPQLSPLLETLSLHPTLLVFGGSQGARAVNQFFDQNRASILSQSYNIIHVTGTSFFASHFSGKQPTFRDTSTGAVCLVLPYCEDMKSLYDRASIVISRAGATTVAELITFQKKALLIPYPYAKDNHQLYNAQSFAKTGNGLVLDEKMLSLETFWSSVDMLNKLSFQPTYSKPATTLIRNVISTYL